MMKQTTKKIHWLCESCGKECFDYVSQRKRKNQGRFCSRSCVMSSQMRGNKINIGRIPSEKTLEQRRVSMLGKNTNPKSQITKDKIRRTLTGRKDSLETKLKKSHPAWNKGLRGFRVGALNNMWKGGITPENKKIRHSIEYKLWVDAVFARDGYICQKYGTRGGNLHAHHILNFAQYPELRFAIDNGISLSEKAHKELHRKYGMKNNTKEQLTEFLNITIV